MEKKVNTRLPEGNKRKGGNTPEPHYFLTPHVVHCDYLFPQTRKSTEDTEFPHHVAVSRTLKAPGNHNDDN